jgi:hypothetical protein
MSVYRAYRMSARSVGQSPTVAPVTSRARVAAAAWSVPTSHRPRSTAEYSQHHERLNRHTGHARPRHLTKIRLRALVEAFRGPAKRPVVVAGATGQTQSAGHGQRGITVKRRGPPGHRCGLRDPHRTQRPSPRSGPAQGVSPVSNAPGQQS